MANNEALYDAVIAGAAGSQDRWLTASDSSSYDGAASAAESLATAVDAAIPAIEGGPSISEINLLQSIVQAVVSGRSLVGLAADSYAPIAASIAALWTEQKASLFDEPSLSGGSGTVFTLTYDPGTLSIGITRSQTLLAGLVQNMPVVISPRFNSQVPNEVGVISASCPAADTIEIFFINMGEDTINPGERSYDIAQIVSS